MVHYRVENIDTAPIETVPRDASVRETLETMFATGSQQVGVETDGEIEGVVTHRSVTRMLLILARCGVSESLMGRPVDLAMEDPEPVVDGSDDIYTLFGELAESPYVLVRRDAEYHVLQDVGFHQYLKGELEAFMLVEEIERAIRDLFRDAYAEDLPGALRETFDEVERLRTPASVEECSFAHYHIFLSANWETFESYFDEDREFVRELVTGVGEIRNNLFHFRGGDHATSIDTDYVAFVKNYFDDRRDSK